MARSHSMAFPDAVVIWTTDFLPSIFTTRSDSMISTPRLASEPDQGVHGPIGVQDGAARIEDSVRKCFTVELRKSPCSFVTREPFDLEAERLKSFEGRGF
jgi:hypothetical protein